MCVFMCFVVCVFRVWIGEFGDGGSFFVSFLLIHIFIASLLYTYDAVMLFVTSGHAKVALTLKLLITRRLFTLRCFTIVYFLHSIII